MIDYVKLALSKYAEFSGRSRRSEFWYFYLFQLIVIWGLMFIAGLLSGVSETIGMVGFGLFGIAILGLLVPSIAVTVRRLHDIGKSGWSYFISLIPIVGGIILIVWLAKEGDAGPNEYGLDPKSPEGEALSRNLIEEDLV